MLACVTQKIRNAEKAKELNGIENITVVEIDVTHPVPSKISH